MSETLIKEFTDVTETELDKIIDTSYEAYRLFSVMPLAKRVELLYSIADKLEHADDSLIQTAMAESHLPEARMRGERMRTVFQLRSYADHLKSGAPLELRIDTADAGKTPPKPDLRKMNVPLGPVVVFGSSNFPFAYSTAGGDTASALAAGCSVIVKAHGAHATTSEMVAELIHSAVEECGLPQGLFAHVHGKGSEAGQYLAKHNQVAAVGFTGSYAGGKSLFDAANSREVPIPVFAEMGSVNPVYILPEKLAAETEAIATALAGSITLGVGQFCTNPGLIIACRGEAADSFLKFLQGGISRVAAATMLHSGIAKSYHEGVASALGSKGVSLVTTGDGVALSADDALPVVATVSAADFLKQPKLHHEVFGPFSLVILCDDLDEMQEVAAAMQGQLTATLWATDEEAKANINLLNGIQEQSGRLVFNGVPTGVEVALSMHHGGPFPASTDSRFTSVGGDAIRRFMRPVCFQNFPDQLLPEPLQKSNPLNLIRTVNNKLTDEAI